MAVATSELIWIKSFLASLGIFHEQPMKLFSDNQAALHIAKNPMFHKGTKHIEVDCHFVLEKLTGGLLTLMHVTLQHQPLIFSHGTWQEAVSISQEQVGHGQLTCSNLRESVRNMNCIRNGISTVYILYYPICLIL